MIFSYIGILQLIFPGLFYVHAILLQHMYLFYLPDEVMFYRHQISPTLLSLPKHQCKYITASFELVGEGESQGLQSRIDSTCAPGEYIIVNRTQTFITCFDFY